MTIAFLATGDEIVHGDTLNTNSQQLASILSSEGLSIGMHLSCSDKEEDMVQCIEFLRQAHDTIIITGGLGPTSDDRTRFALAKLIDVPLLEFPEALQHIQKRLADVNVQNSPNNSQQALFPQGSSLLKNPKGTAMGCIYTHLKQCYILLPGPPRECLPMFNQQVLPLLLKHKRSNKSIMSWRVFGLPESQIGEMLENLLINTPYQSGYRLETPYVEVKIRFPKGETETVKSLIEPVLAPYIISPPHQSASAQLRSYLDEKPQHAISIIDQVSGGILQSLIQTPKNHQWVHFSNGNGTEEFAATFIIQGFKEYWHGNLSPTGTSLVNIEYQNANLIGNEEHSIPCRSTMPRHFAAEWLSFRLFHLLNQLH